MSKFLEWFKSNKILLSISAFLLAVAVFLFKLLTLQKQKTKIAETERDVADLKGQITQADKSVEDAKSKVAKQDVVIKESSSTLDQAKQSYHNVRNEPRTENVDSAAYFNSRYNSDNSGDSK